MELEENLVGVRNERKKISPKRVKFRRKEGNLMGVEGELNGSKQCCDSREMFIKLNLCRG
jgi:hypothetical protein